MDKINSIWVDGKFIQETTVTKATSEYAWARITDDILNKIDIRDLKRDYFVKFVDWTEIPHNAWLKTPDNTSETDPYLIWCQKIEICEYAIGSDASLTRITYRPVKKADIPAASFD